MSIHNIIMKNMNNDGRLPQGFSLETIGKDKKGEEIKYAAGMMDGTAIYHSVNLLNPGDPNKAANEIAILLIKYFEDNDKRHTKEIEDILAKNSTISIVDGLAEIMWETLMNIDNPDEWTNTANLWTDATLDLITKSESMDFVKIGITMLGVVGFDCFDRSAEILFNMAAYDGLTVYALSAFSRLVNVCSRLNPEQPIKYNEIVFEIAQRVDGWGRVHAAERLEPETDEIRRWLLTRCCTDGFLSMYLALNCAEKADMISVLKQETVDDELFQGITAIFEGLIEADMVPGGGLNSYEQGKEALKLYVRHAKDRPEHESDRVTDLLLALSAKEMQESEENDCGAH